MSAPHALEPGTRLVDRYRLDEFLGQAEDTTYWRATDELLDRPVGVCLLGGQHPNAEQVLGAARRAAAVSDPRFLRVLDANEADGVVYVVSEWVSASNLADLVAERPLTAGHAREIALEVAGALDAAHREGLAHLCLTPEHVLRTAHGQIKVAGLAVDAAVHGLPAADDAESAARDARGVAAILYAALTARWPGEESTQVAPAPHDGGRLCSPRQVKAGVPDDLDTLVGHMLGAAPRHGHGTPEPPVRTPAELVERLTATAATSRIPVVRPASEPHGDTPPPYAGGPYLARYDDEGARRGRLAGRTAYALVAVVLLVGLGLAGWQFASADFGNAGTPAGSSSSNPADTPSPGKAIKVASATTLDPPPAGNGEENSDRAGRTVDNDPASVWTTKTYDQQFGPTGLKEGVGLVLDLGSKQRVTSLDVTTVGGSTDFEVRVAGNQGQQLDDYTKVATSPGADGKTKVALDKPAQARFVLIWLTSIPQADGGFRGAISDVTVRG